MSLPAFHLSIGVHDMEAEVKFFVDLLGATVQHRDPSGYVNIDFYGTQITLKHNPELNPNLPDFHFGVNLSLENFDRLATSVLRQGERYVSMKPEVWEAGTVMERKKMYLKCPTGYLIEIKGYRR